MTVKVDIVKVLSGHRQSVYALTLGEHGEIYSAGSDGYIVKWNPLHNDDGLVIARVPEPVYTLAYDATYKRLYAGSHSGYLYCIEGGEARNILAHAQGLFTVCIDEAGIYTGGGDGRLLRWTRNLELVQQSTLSKKSIRKIIPIPKGIAAASSDGNIYILNREPSLTQIISRHAQSVFALAWLPGQNVLVSGGRDAVLQFSHWPDTDKTEEVKAHLLHIHDLKLSPDKKLLASASMDKTIKLWDAETMKLLKVLDKDKYGIHLSSVNRVEWMDHSTLISASDDRTLGVWNIEN